MTFKRSLEKLLDRVGSDDELIAMLHRNIAKGLSPRDAKIALFEIIRTRYDKSDEGGTLDALRRLRGDPHAPDYNKSDEGGPLDAVRQARSIRSVGMKQAPAVLSRGLLASLPLGLQECWRTLSQIPPLTPAAQDMNKVLARRYFEVAGQMVADITAATTVQQHIADADVDIARHFENFGHLRTLCVRGVGRKAKHTLEWILAAGVGLTKELDYLEKEDKASAQVSMPSRHIKRARHLRGSMPDDFEPRGGLTNSLTG